MSKIDMSKIDNATQRLNRALDRLGAIGERRLSATKDLGALKRELEALQEDRSRLASELDAAHAQARHYSTLVDEVSGRLDVAIDELRDVLGTKQSG